MTTVNSAEQAIIDRFVKQNVAFLAPDQGIQRNHHINERNEREDAILEAGLDPHLMAEIRGNLQAALDETFNVAEMVVAAPAAQCGDMSTGYFTADGDLAIGSSRGVAGFTISLHYTIRFILKYFRDDPTVGINPGDGFLINDCHYGGIHSPDQHLFMPLFVDGELVGWDVCAMHEGEIGAKVPGGMGPTCESIWDEGFRGSPIKIVENYRLKTDLVTLVQNNSREPQNILADLKARLASCERMESRFMEQVAQHGVDNLIGFMRSNVEYMAEEARRRIEALPDGTMRHTFYIDTTMREPALLRCNYNFTVKGDKVLVDFRGSAPELFNRPINSLLSTQAIGICIAMAQYAWPDLPVAQAIMDRFEFITDERSLLDASPEVPVALCMQGAFKAITAAELAFSKFYHGAPVRYSKTKAAWYNQPQSIIYGGVNQHHDSVGNMCAELNAMAGGAKFDEDGEHSIAPNFGAFTDVGEAEQTEELLPFVYTISKRLWPDNNGFGKYRGGSAYQFGLMRFGDSPFGFQGFNSGAEFPSTFGLWGGYASPAYAICRIRGKNLFEDFKSNPEWFKADMFTLMNEQPFEGAEYLVTDQAVDFDLYAEGELFMMTQGAGGGYGDVLERDPELVMKDLDEDLISHQTARELYKIIYDEERLVVDREATVAAREAERRARVERGMDWDDFIAANLKDEPPGHLPFFGAWNGSEEIYAGPYGKFLPGQHPPLMFPDPLAVENAALKQQIAELKSQGGQNNGK